MDEAVPSEKSGVGNGPGNSESPVGSSPTRSWIENRGLLRDEATVLGLAGLEEGLEHKVEVIRTHFEEKKAEVQRRREQIGQKLKQIEKRRSKAKEKIDRLQERIQDPPVPEMPQSGGDRRFFLRYAVGLLFAAGICGFNFFLLHELLQDYFGRPLLVTAGICCAGLFALFQPTSLFFRAGRSAVAPWKRWLAEVGMPVAASLFAVSWSYEALGPLRAGSLFLYLAMTFLLGGKLLLSTIPRLGTALCSLWGNVRSWWIRRRTRRKRNQIQEEVLPSLNEEEASLARRQAKLPTPSEIESRREAAAHLFRSEYAVAQGAASNGLISPDDRRNITSNTDR